jgi:hypothetical protein
VTEPTNQIAASFSRLGVFWKGVTKTKNDSFSNQKRSKVARIRRIYGKYIYIYIFWHRDHDDEHEHEHEQEHGAAAAA